VNPIFFLGLGVGIIACLSLGIGIGKNLGTILVVGRERQVDGDDKKI
jgi:hypothetical protein